MRGGLGFALSSAAKSRASSADWWSNATASLCASMSARSAGVASVLSGTTTAPARAAPNAQIANSGRFAKSSATCSPGEMPAATRPPEM